MRRQADPHMCGLGSCRMRQDPQSAPVVMLALAAAAASAALWVFRRHDLAGV